MSTPPISESYAHRIVAEIEQCLTEGFKRKGLPSAMSEAGLRMKPSRRINTYTLDRIRELYGLVPDWGLYRQTETATSKPEVPSIVIKPVYRVGANTSDGRDKIFVCAIGDAHDSPTISKDRFRWIGKHIKELKHDYVVQIGDFASLDSLCRYVPFDLLVFGQLFIS